MHTPAKKFATISIKKYKSRYAIQRSFKHIFREQHTPNAEKAKRHLNIEIGARSSVQGLKKLEDAICQATN